MSLFGSDNEKEKKHSGILGAFSVDNIKWEPEDPTQASLIARRYPYEDFPNGSYLHVAQSQMAVFTNNMNAGSSSEGDDSGLSQVSVFIGPCKIKLDTGDSRFAPFRNVTHKLTDGSSAFHSVVYFINTTYMNELRWGTQDPIIVQDPEEDVNVHVRAYGLFGAHIDQTDPAVASVNALKFIRKVVGTREAYSREELTNFMRAKILEYVPDLLAKSIINRQISVLKIQAYMSEFSTELKDKLSNYFYDFGLTLDNFSFNSISPFEEDLAAVNEMKIKKKRDMLDAQGNAARMDIESEERSMDVLQAAAGNESSAGSGIMNAGVGLGMAAGVGSAIGKGVAGLADDMLSTASGKSDNDSVVCPECGASNPKGAKFCVSCGHKFKPAGAVCPNCGHVNPAGAKFCMECGTPLVQKKLFCPNCGKELESGAKFCPECGTKIGGNNV